MVMNQTKNIKKSIFEGNQKHIKETREKTIWNELKMEKIIAESEKQKLLLLHRTKGIEKSISEVKEQNLLLQNKTKIQSLK